MPERPSIAGIRYSVFRNGAQVLEGKGSWNVNYVPFYAVDRHPDGRTARMLYVMPLQLKAGEGVDVRVPPDGAVHHARLRPAIPGLAAELAVDLAHRIYFAGETPNASVTLDGPDGLRVRGRLLVQQLRLADSAGGDRSWNPDDRLTEVRRLADLPVDLTLAGGKALLPVRLPNDANRCVGLTAVIEDGAAVWPKYLGCVSFVPPRDTGRYHDDGMFICSLHIDIRKDELFAHRCPVLKPEDFMAALKRFGIDWLRNPMNWGSWEPKDGQVDWSTPDAIYGAFRRNHLRVMHLVGPVPPWARASGEGLVEGNYKGGKITVDTAPAKTMLGRFGKAHEEFFRRYADVVRATNVWNEPWEGMGITGWKSTGEHYRNIVRQIRRAAKAADPAIKVVAADSPHNTLWKLVAAGAQDDIEVISTHYSPPATAYSFSMARHLKKEVWETETWLAWQGDAASVRHALHYFAVGGDRVSLFNEQMFYDVHGNPTPCTVWAAAMRYMLDGLHFTGMVHPERPPFIIMFAGEGRQVAAVTTSLQSSGKVDGPFRRQFAGDRATLRVKAAENLRVYDLLANLIDARAENGRIAVPVDDEPRYVEYRGPMAEFEAILADAACDGIRPVEITIHDITGRLDAKPKLRVILRNAYGQPLAGTVRVEADGLRLEPAEQPIALKPAAEAAFVFALAGADKPNAFPVRVLVNTDRGSAELRETVYCSVVCRGTPVVDGDAAEWEKLGAVPVAMTATDDSAAEQLQAWFPWETFTQADSSLAAQVAFASDDRFLYMMARVKDASRSLVPSMMAGKQLHQFQKAPADHMYVEVGPTPGATGDHIQLALSRIDTDPFEPLFELYPPDHPLHRFGTFIRTQYLYLIYPTDEGGADVIRARTPDFYFLHPLPYDYAWMAEHCKVKGASTKVTQLDGGYVYELALPWTELKTLPHASGDEILMSVLVQDKGPAARLQWSAGRSAARSNMTDFEPGFGGCWSNDTRWGFAK